MDVDRNKQQMRKIVEVFATGDVAKVDQLVADDYIDHQGISGNPIRGREGFRTVVESARRFSSPRVTVEEMLAEGDLVAARLRWRWTEPATAQGRETIDIMRFEDGVAAEHWGAHAPV